MPEMLSKEEECFTLLSGFSTRALRKDFLREATALNSSFKGALAVVKEALKLQSVAGITECAWAERRHKAL